MKKQYKVTVAYEIEYTVEAENEDEAYEAVHDRDEFIDKRWLHEETLGIEEVNPTAEPTS